MLPTARTSLRRDFAWMFSSNVLYWGSQWAMVVVLAKLGTPEAVGDYVFGMAVAAPVMLLANFQLRSLVASDVTDEYPFARYLRFRLWSLAAALAGVMGVCAVSRFPARTTAIAGLMAVAIAYEALGELYYGLMQKQDRLDRVAVSRMIKGPASVVALGLAMYFTHDVVWAVAALAAARATVWLFYDARTQAPPPAEAVADKSLKPLLRTSVTLGVILMAVSLNTNMPRYFIQGYLNNRELGIFSAIASLLGVGNMMMSAIGQTSFLRIAVAHTQEDPSEFRKLIAQTLAMAVFVGGCGIAAAVVGGSRLLSILFRPEYAAHSGLFIWLMAAGCVSYATVALGQAMTATRCFTPQLPLTLVTAAATALSCHWLIPMHGLRGAAQACLIGACVQLAGGTVIFSMWRWQARSLRSASGNLAVGAEA